MDKVELKKANGDVFFTAQRAVGNSFIHVNWIGIQSLETIMYGAGQLLVMLQKLPCKTILNSNQELIGPWDDGALYLGNTWAPKAKHLGLNNFVQVLAPGIYGKRSFEKFQQLAGKFFKIETFEHEQDAEDWIPKA